MHIADPAYFETLNQRFKEYDALLYEMVKPKGMDGVRRAEPGEEDRRRGKPRASPWVRGGGQDTVGHVDYG